MKFIAMTIVIFMLSAVSNAADEPASAEKGMGKMNCMKEGKMQGMENMNCMGGKQMQGMGGMGNIQGMGEMSPEQMEQKMRSMQEYMLKMHDLSNQILSEKKPIKKQVLKDKQLELMKKHMKKMQNKHKMNKKMKMMQ